MIASLKINLVSMKCFINPFFLLKVNITRLEFYTKQQRALCECLQGFKCQGILAELPITNNRLMAAGSCCFAEARTLLAHLPLVADEIYRAQTVAVP